MNPVAHIKLRLPNREPVRSSVNEDEIYEMIDFREVDQKPCSKRVRRFVSSQNSPSISKLPGNIVSDLPILKNILYIC